MWSDDDEDVGKKFNSSSGAMKEKKNLASSHRGASRSRYVSSFSPPPYHTITMTCT